jgi:hypothetical protein
VRWHHFFGLQEEDCGDDYGDDEFEAEDLLDGGDCIDEEATNESDGRELLDFRRDYRAAEVVMRAAAATSEGEEEEDFHDSMDLQQQGQQQRGVFTSDSNSSAHKSGSSQQLSPPFSHTRPAAHSMSSKHNHARFEKNVEYVEHATRNERKVSPIGTYSKHNAEQKSEELATPLCNEEDDISILALRLKALGPAKQGELMALLREMEGAGAGTGASAGVSAEEVVKSNTRNALHSSDPRRSSDIPAPLHATPASGKNICDEDMPQRTISIIEKQGSDTCQPSSTKLKIRIKVYNSWEKTKYASLSAIRLCVKGGNDEIPLSEFSVRVIVFVIFIITCCISSHYCFDTYTTLYYIEYNMHVGFRLQVETTFCRRQLKCREMYRTSFTKIGPCKNRSGCFLS